MSLNLKNVSLSFAVLLLCLWSQAAPITKEVPCGVALADSLLHTILDKYHVEKYGLFLETYPVDPNNHVTYLAEGAEQQRNQEVSFLWPYSGMLSGLVAMYEYTGNQYYLDLLEERILPGLELYGDTTREPFCYQSYPRFNNESDRFYDDNVWLALDFCDLYRLTRKVQYLNSAVRLYTYIYSGWDELAGGGIYWCEQRKTSKNTCSNAPAAVLCMKLYELTKEEVYLEQAKATYHWTKKYLMDPEDYVYWDNVRLDGSIGKEKYTYNSGQMIQAAILLFCTTGQIEYFEDATRTAKGTYHHFTSSRRSNQGEKMIFYPTMPWFNVILLRGLLALYEIDEKEDYIRTMVENVVYAWKYTRDEHGLLGADWSGQKNKKHKWLLDNASMLELYTRISPFID